MNNDIKIGSTVNLLYWKDKKVHEFVVTDIFFERYLFDYKTRVEAKYYSEKSDLWFIETYYINDFFDAMKKAKEAEQEAENEWLGFDDGTKTRPEKMRGSDNG